MHTVGKMCAQLDGPTQTQLQQYDINVRFLFVNGLDRYYVIIWCKTEMSTKKLTIDSQ